MKKYLLFIISMLCVSIGTWADPTPFYTGASSTYEISGGTITLNINASGEIEAALSDWQKWNYGQNMPSDIAAAKTAGFTTLKIITAANVAMTSGDGEGLYAFGNNYQVLDLSQATVTLNYGKVRLGGITNHACQPNIIVPAAYSSAPGTFPAADQYGNDITGGVNLYSIDGTTVNAAMNNSTVTTALTNISSTATRMKIMNEVGAIDLRSVITSEMVSTLSPLNYYTIDLMDITNVSSGSNDITVEQGVKVVCSSVEVGSRIKGTNESNVTVVSPVISCTAGELSGKLTTLEGYGVAPTSITITSGELSSTDIESLNIEGLTYLSLENATLADNINTLTIPSTLQSLTLPKNATPETAIDATLLDKVKDASSLLYVYVPYSGEQNANQKVADYVWVNQPGGLWQAMEKENHLRTAVYVKIACDVAGGVQLNEDDAKFGNHSINASSEKDYPWQYIDLSGTFFGVAATNANTAPHAKGYRIILPNNLTGDHMAIFASKPETDKSDDPDRGYRGKVAAVYSYNGTKLSLLEITDKTYHNDALADSRIVRSGTTEVKVISGSYNGTTFSKFGPNLLAAINAADDTPGDNTTNHITKVTVAVGDGIYTAEDAKVSSATTFAFNNDNLTNLDLSYTNNSYVTIDVSGCAGLTNFQMNEATVAAVDAHGINGLATVSLGHTIVSGNVDLSNTNSTNTSLTSDLEVDLANIGGTLNVSGTNATSFDFSKLTATSVDASGTTALTSLNLNGIKLNGMGSSSPDDISSSDISDLIGTVKVTRSSSGNYSNLTISTASADDFDQDRIVPGWSTITPEGNRYTLSAIQKVLVEITAAGSTLSDNVAIALSAIGGTPAPTAANVEILHVTGTLTTTDLEYIKDNMPALKLLDLSAATLSGVTATNLTTASANSKKISTSTAIVLPGSTNTESGKLADVKTLQDAGFECVAYYTSKTANNYRLNVYAYSGTVGKLKSSSPAVIDNATGITFLPRYYDTTPESTSNQYPEAQPSLLTALGTLPPFSIDMTWLNIDKLGVNFGGLNENTHYLVIPQNSSAATITRSGIVYHNDFTTTGTDGVVDGTEHRYYHFGENIYAVSTYKSQNGPWAQKAYFGGEATELGPWIPNKQSTANLTYVKSMGHLGACIPYMSTRQTEAEIHAIAGAVNSTDITSLNSGVTNSYLDLSRSTLSGEIAWSSYSNASVKIIVMPHEYSTTASGLPTVGSCAQLYGIGCHLLSDVDVSNGTKKCTLVYMAQKEGGMADMIKASNRIHPGLTTRYNRVTSLIVGGPVNAFDLSTRTDGIDANGHLVTTVENNNITGLGAGTKGGALSGYASIEGWDLSAATLPTYTEGANVAEGNRSYRFDNATHTYAESESSASGFSYQNDLCYSLLGIAMPTQLTDVTLPANNTVWRIADKALEKCKLITNDELHIPHNYQYIGNGAFLDTEIGHITTTDATGNLIDNGAKTYTLSANLKEIGNNPGAGNGLNSSQTVFPQNNGVTDVYILAHKVPLCYKNAFPANMTYGWGGFKDASTPYCREKYENTPYDGSRIMTILRFPDKQSFTEEDGAKEGTYEAMQRKYTDVTKVYTKKEQTGAVDANGNEILWPTFTELNRVYNQANAGLIWDDWRATYSAAGGVLEVQEGNVIPTTTAPAAKDNPGEGNHATLITTEEDEEYRFSNYEGWHQFVLSQATYVEPDVLNKTERNFVEGGWYTFCIPFDLTESQVYEMLGVPYSNARYTNKVRGNTIKKAGDVGGYERILPDIRTLASVTRKPGNTNQISLLLTSNMVTTSAGENTFHYYNINDADPASSALAPITETIGDEKIAIKGGYPYYIKPYLPEGVTVTNLGKYVMTRYADIFKLAASCQRNAVTKESINKSALATLQFAKPFEKHKIQAYLDKPGEEGYTKHHDNDVNPSNDKKYYYTFIGQFWDQKLPRYCYYTMEGTGNWYRFSNFTNESQYKWYAYKCVILVTQEVDDTNDHPQSGKFRDATNCFYPTIKEKTTDQLNGTLKLAFLDGIDDYDFANSARECIFLFDEDIMDLGDGSQTTAIESLDGENIVPSTQGKVYNMAGQHVGNSLEGLSKGMYIVNGKKYVIK